MGDVEPIVVIILTYDNGDGVRTEYLRRTIQALRQNFIYPDLWFYLADDGSPEKHVQIALKELEGFNMLGWHTIPDGSYGQNANRAWQASREKSRLTAWIEDDWILNRELDIRPYADLLMDNEHLGMVRMGYLNLGMVGKTIGYRGKLYWWLSRESDEAYVFTGHPSLRHWRFREAYGPYQEGLKPGETELSMAWQFRTKPGPGIVYPVESGEWGPFAHIGEVQSYQ